MALPSFSCAKHTVQAFLRHAESGDLAERLATHGLQDSAAKARMFAAAAQRLLDEGVKPGAVTSAYWVPGRIEVGGKHTDYAGGRSLLCNAPRGFAAVSADRPDSTLCMFASFALAGIRASSELPISADAGISASGDSEGGWA